MKKTLIISLIALLSVVLVYGFADAKVSGRCDGCHTMHYSQDGGVPTGADAGGPFGALLKNSCVGCHSNTTDAQTIVDTKPKVWNTSGYPGQALAGGNFYNVAAAGKTKVHNVAGVTVTTDIAPPGFKSVPKPNEFVQGGAGWGPAAWNAGTQVTCAGELGCHGDRSTGYTNYQGVRGGHHSDDSTIDGTTVAKSYRFLAGIKGVELNTAGYQWEQTADSTHHNGYMGVIAVGADDDNTISYLCAECHGKFHTWEGGAAEVGTSSSWLRHPTDIAFAASGGSSFDNTGYTVYNTETPVALATPSTSEPVVGSTSRVLCISCHRAHGSAYDDILRFAYDASIGAGSAATTGCLRCHKRQR